MAKSVIDIVKERLLEKIKETNQLPWQKPWQSQEAINYVSRKSYQGINRLLLDKEGEYLTANQIKDLGGIIKKGSKSEIVVFSKEIEKKDEGNIIRNEKGEAETIRMLRYYRVFHISDTEGIESKFKEFEKKEMTPSEKSEVLLAIVEAYKDKPEIIHNRDNSQAYWQSTTDKINMPEKERFKDENEYYSTLIHELAHSTGATERLNRDMSKYAYSKDARSKEELIAEITAASMMLKAGVISTQDNSDAYIQSWAKYLKDEKASVIISAASQAEKAMNYMIGEFKKEKTQELTGKISILEKVIDENISISKIDPLKNSRKLEVLSDIKNKISQITDKTQEISYTSLKFKDISKKLDDVLKNEKTKKIANEGMER